MHRVGPKGENVCEAPAERPSRGEEAVPVDAWRAQVQSELERFLSLNQGRTASTPARAYSPVRPLLAPPQHLIQLCHLPATPQLHRLHRLSLDQMTRIPIDGFAEEDRVR